LIPSRLQRYVLFETLRVASISALALTGIVFVGTSLSLVNRGLSVTQIPGIVGYIFAFSLPYALPAALLVATVFVFGRLSGMNELIAISSSGVNLNHIILSPVFISLLVLAGTFGLNHYVLPWSRTEVKNRTNEMIGQALRSVGDVQNVYKLGDYHIYVGRVDPDNGTWRNVAVVEYTPDDFPRQIMIADEASCQVNAEKQEAALRLRNGMTMTPQLGNVASVDGRTAISFGDMTVSVSLERRLSTRPKYLELPGLRARMRQLKKVVRRIRVSEPELSGTVHPKTKRKSVERKMDKAWRAFRQLKREADSRVAAVLSARARVEETQEDYRVAELAHMTVVERSQRLRERFETRKPLLDSLRADIDRLREAEADPGEIAAREREFATEKAAVDRISASLKIAEREQGDVARALSDAQRELDDRNDLLEEAVSYQASAQKEADAANAAFTKHKTLYGNVKKLESLLRAETVYHYRNAGAASGLVFVLIGIPLGILSRRGSVIIAFALSFFAVLLIYYPLMMVARMLSLDGYVMPVVAQWMPNVVAGGIGLYLLCKVIRR